MVTNFEVDLVLASASPRRNMMLTELGWSFSVVRPQVDESARPGESPRESALRLACDKAVAGSLLEPGKLAIGSDTVVDVDGRLLGKPRDRADARQMLRTLSGRSHLVHSGVALARDGELEKSAVESTTVKFVPLSDEDILAFLSTGEGDDKAGAYAIQGRGALLIEGICGDYSTVVGLPLQRLSCLLAELGWQRAGQWVRA